jgi:hypothetical protein
MSQTIEPPLGGSAAGGQGGDEHDLASFGYRQELKR